MGDGDEGAGPSGPDDPQTSVRLVRTALLLLPRSLRDEIGPDVLETFRMRARTARSAGGHRRLAALLVRELAGLLRTAIRSRRPDPWTRRTAPGAVRDRASSTLERSMDKLRLDLRYSFRTLTRRPGMMGLAALSLALGIGASTAMFGVVDSVLQRLRPYLQGDPRVASGVLHDHASRGALLRAIRATLHEASPGTPRSVQDVRLGAVSFLHGHRAKRGPAPA